MKPDSSETGTDTCLLEIQQLLCENLLVLTAPEQDPMAERCFDLILKGEIEPGHSQDEIRCTLESLFAFDTESQVDLFSGHPVVLGMKMNTMTANLFKQALADAGIETHLLAANDTVTDQEIESRRLVQRRNNARRRSRIRGSAILPDRREGLNRRTVAN